MHDKYCGFAVSPARWYWLVPWHKLITCLWIYYFLSFLSTLCSGLAFGLVIHLAKRQGWFWFALQFMHDRGNRSQMGSMWMFPVCLAMIKSCYVIKGTKKSIAEIEIIILLWGFQMLLMDLVICVLQWWHTAYLHRLDKSKILLSHIYHVYIIPYETRLGKTPPFVSFLLFYLDLFLNIIFKCQNK